MFNIFELFSDRMRTIKEYPFDFSDVKEEGKCTSSPQNSRHESSSTSFKDPNVKQGEISAPQNPKRSASTSEPPHHRNTLSEHGSTTSIDRNSNLRKNSDIRNFIKNKIRSISSSESHTVNVIPNMASGSSDGVYLNPQSILSSALRKTSNNERKISNFERKVSIMTNDQDKNSNDASRNGRVSSHQVEGPSRRKSNLHNHLVADIDNSWDRHSHIEGRYKKYSTTSTIYSKKALSQQSEPVERSCWYACCAKCHQEDSGIPSWEPPHWQKVCPYPFCPSYRKTARILIICLIGVMIWLTLWLIMGDAAAPGGQLFTLAVLTIAAHLGGWIMFKVTTLPSLLGMLVTGVIAKNIGFVHFDKEYLHVVALIRKIALTILLIRAGLDLDPHALKKHFLTVIKLSLLPWTFEFALFGVLAYCLFGLPWEWAFLLSSIIAAVSPALIVPCLLRLRKKGYGVHKGIPTLVLAVSGIDDATSVAVFGIIFNILFTNTSLTMTILQGPLSIVVGVGSGIILGYFVKYVPERNESFLVPLRVLFLLFGGVLSMLGFEEIGWGGAGPLAVITFAFIAYKNWAELGWELEDNPAITVFEIFWMFFEPLLFSVTGAQVAIADIPVPYLLVGGGLLLGCAILRIIVTSLFAVRSNLNLKEKIFVGLAWMGKATVQLIYSYQSYLRLETNLFHTIRREQDSKNNVIIQIYFCVAFVLYGREVFRVANKAALGPVAVDEVRKLTSNGEPNPEMTQYAETVAILCILSIAITAPIGAIVITLTGPKLLSRTTKPPILEGWRKSNRPSIRDISIIDEEEVAERDAELSQPRPESPYKDPASTPITNVPVTTQPTSIRDYHSS